MQQSKGQRGGQTSAGKEAIPVPEVDQEEMLKIFLAKIDLPRPLTVVEPAGQRETENDQLFPVRGQIYNKGQYNNLLTTTINRQKIDRTEEGGYEASLDCVCFNYDSANLNNIFPTRLYDPEAADQDWSASEKPDSEFNVFTVATRCMVDRRTTPILIERSLFISALGDYIQVHKIKQQRDEYYETASNWINRFIRCKYLHRARTAGQRNDESICHTEHTVNGFLAHLGSPTNHCILNAFFISIGSYLPDPRASINWLENDDEAYEAQEQKNQARRDERAAEVLKKREAQKIKIAAEKADGVPENERTKPKKYHRPRIGEKISHKPEVWVSILQVCRLCGMTLVGEQTKDDDRWTIACIDHIKAHADAGDLLLDKDAVLDEKIKLMVWGQSTLDRDVVETDRGLRDSSATFKEGRKSRAATKTKKAPSSTEPYTPMPSRIVKVKGPGETSISAARLVQIDDEIKQPAKDVPWPPPLPSEYEGKEGQEQFITDRNATRALFAYAEVMLYGADLAGHKTLPGLKHAEWIPFYNKIAAYSDPYNYVGQIFDTREPESRRDYTHLIFPDVDGRKTGDSYQKCGAARLRALLKSDFIGSPASEDLLQDRFRGRELMVRFPHFKLPLKPRYRGYIPVTVATPIVNSIPMSPGMLAIEVAKLAQNCDRLAMRGINAARPMVEQYKLVENLIDDEKWKSPFEDTVVSTDLATIGIEGDMVDRASTLYVWNSNTGDNTEEDWRRTTSNTGVELTGSAPNRDLGWGPGRGLTFGQIDPNASILEYVHNPSWMPSLNLRPAYDEVEYRPVYQGQPADDGTGQNSRKRKRPPPKTGKDKSAAAAAAGDLDHDVRASYNYELLSADEDDDEPSVHPVLPRAADGAGPPRESAARAATSWRGAPISDMELSQIPKLNDITRQIGGPVVLFNGTNSVDYINYVKENLNNGYPKETTVIHGTQRSICDGHFFELPDDASRYFERFGFDQLIELELRYRSERNARIAIANANTQNPAGGSYSIGWKLFIEAYADLLLEFEWVRLTTVKNHLKQRAATVAEEPVPKKQRQQSAAAAPAGAAAPAVAALAQPPRRLLVQQNRAVPQSPYELGPKMMINDPDIAARSRSDYNDFPEIFAGCLIQMMTRPDGRQIHGEHYGQNHLPPIKSVARPKAEYGVYESEMKAMTDQAFLRLQQQFVNEYYDRLNVLRDDYKGNHWYTLSHVTFLENYGLLFREKYRRQTLK